MAKDDLRISPSTVYFAEATSDFPAGTRVLVDPADRYSPGQWLLVRPRSGGVPWFAGAVVRGDDRWLRRLDGEVILYAEDRHEIVGVIVGSILPPPPVPSAPR